MSSLAEDIYNVIQDVQTDLGRTVSLSQTTDGAFIDVNAPSKGRVQTTTSTNITSIIYEVDEDLIDGTLIKKGDKSIIFNMKSYTVTPTQDDKVTIGSEVYKLVHTKKVWVGSTLVGVFGVMRK